MEITMELIHIRTTVLIINLVFVTYNMIQTDKMLTRYNQRIYDNFALCHKLINKLDDLKQSHNKLYSKTMPAIHQTNVTHGVVSEAQKDVINLLSKVHNINIWIDKQEEQKLIDNSNDYEISSNVNKDKLNDLKKYVYKLEDKFEKLLTGDHPAPVTQRIDMLEKKTYGLILKHKDDGVFIGNRTCGRAEKRLIKIEKEMEECWSKANSATARALKIEDKIWDNENI